MPPRSRHDGTWTGIRRHCTVPSWVPQLRGKRSKRSLRPLDSYGGTPKAVSDRNGTTTIRSAMADLPLDHILRARGGRVET